VQISALTPASDEKISAYALYDSARLARLAIVNFNEWNGTNSFARPNTTFTVKGLSLNRATGRRLTAPDGASADTDLTFGGLRWNFSTNGLSERAPGIEGEEKLDLNENSELDVVVGASEAMLVELELNDDDDV